LVSTSWRRRVTNAKDLRANSRQKKTLRRLSLRRTEQPRADDAARRGEIMPAYQNTLPTISLSSGDIGFSFNNETFPGSGWQTVFGTAPTAVNMVLQGAINDVDAEYQTLDTTTVVGGEARTVANVQARFLRVRFVSSTGGTGLTAKILV
jgi:hypothetical protein